jgi:hypothetical protein
MCWALELKVEEVAAVEEAEFRLEPLQRSD